MGGSDEPDVPPAPPGDAAVAPGGHSKFVFGVRGRKTGPWHVGVPLFVPRRVDPRSCISLISTHNSITVGKYLVSALSKPHDAGGYSASVSIRSGRGSASTDRVMRFTPQFDTESAAHQYAHAQGLIWVSERSLPVSARAQ